MKPPLFKYARPDSLADALHILSEFGDAAKVLAGGQSLVPMMNFRLARPSVLVDLQDVDELVGMTAQDNRLRVGAMTRQREVERSPMAGGTASEDVADNADECDFSAAPTSWGSVQTLAMVAACSMRTLAAVTTGLSNDRLARAVDVTLTRVSTIGAGDGADTSPPGTPQRCSGDGGRRQDSADHAGLLFSAGTDRARPYRAAFALRVPAVTASGARDGVGRRGRPGRPRGAGRVPAAVPQRRLGADESALLLRLADRRRHPDRVVPLRGRPKQSVDFSREVR